MLPPETFLPRPAGRPVKRRRKPARLISLVLLTAIAAVGAFYLEENWRGPRVFQKRCEELEARGEKLEFVQFSPPAVPVDQNFLMAAAWGEALKSRDPWDMEFPTLLRIPRIEERDSDTMKFAEWEPWEEQIRQLSDAAAVMPYSVFPAPPGSDCNLGYARLLSESLLIRAKAAQREGKASEAAQSLRILFRLHEAYAARPELFNQLCAVALAGLALFGPAFETNWSPQEAKMIEEGLRRLDRLPDFARALRFDRAYSLSLLIDRDGNLPRPPAGNLLPRGWAGLAFASWLDTYQYRIEREEAWPGLVNKPDPRADGPHIWEGFRKIAVSSDAEIDAARWDCLAVKMRVVLSRLEHAFGCHRREHHRDIEKPEDLLPYLGGSLPLDPYTGKPHLIERDGNRWCMRWNVRGQAPGPVDVYSFPTRRKPRS